MLLINTACRLAVVSDAFSLTTASLQAVFLNMPLAPVLNLSCPCEFFLLSRTYLPTHLPSHPPTHLPAHPFIQQDIPDAREAGLGHLCEFIEDCEFTFLSVQVLHLLGQEGPTTKEPSRCVYVCVCAAGRGGLG